MTASAAKADTKPGEMMTNVAMTVAWTMSATSTTHMAISDAKKTMTARWMTAR